MTGLHSVIGILAALAIPKLLAEQLFENGVLKDALRRKG